MIITYQQTKATQFIELMEGMFGDVNGGDVDAAVPLPVRKASGFPEPLTIRRGFASGSLASRITIPAINISAINIPEHPRH